MASDTEFLPALQAQLVREDAWATPELFKALQFAWGVLLREYASRPDLMGKPPPNLLKFLPLHGYYFNI